MVPGAPEVAVASSFLVRPARTTTSPGAAQKVVSISSEVRSDSSSTCDRLTLKRVSVSLTSSFTVLLRRLMSTFSIFSSKGALYSTGWPATVLLSASRTAGPGTRAIWSLLMVASCPAATRMVGLETTRPRAFVSRKFRSNPSSSFGELRSSAKLPPVVAMASDAARATCESRAS